ASCSFFSFEAWSFAMLPGTGVYRGGLLHRHCIEGNPNFEQLDDFANAEIDEEGNLTLHAWASIVSTAEGPPAPWPTEVLLPMNCRMRLIEAWYGHPSDPSRRMDVTQRVAWRIAAAELLSTWKALPSCHL
ncbi:unnamed protein product, partial [Cladocopium goreaui]